MTLEALAIRLDEAASTATATPQLPSDQQIDATSAYAVQRMVVEKRLQRGERLVGIKMGLTSRAKMEQVNVKEVIFGQLTDGMRHEEGGMVPRSAFIHPRAEPEIAYLLKKPLSGSVSPAEALSAVEAVAPAIEIIDSRYENFKFALGDVIADNSSSSGFVLGNWFAPDTDVANLGIVVRCNGHACEVGSTAAILGHPIRSLVAASDMVSRAGLSLNAGDIVLAGGATAAVPVQANDHIAVDFQNLGRVQFVMQP